MSLQVNISDGSGTDSLVKVTSRGELVVGKIEYSDVHTVEANVIDTAFNFVGPRTSKKFVITDILMSTDRNIGNNGATIEVYSANSATSITVITSELKMELLKNTSRDLTGLNLIVAEGVWLNIKTNDATVFATMMGYFVSA